MTVKRDGLEGYDDLDQGFGVYHCDCCGKPTGNCQDGDGLRLCDDCKVG